jgi:hypothetical protein
MEKKKLVLHYLDGTIGAALSGVFPDGTESLRVETLEGRTIDVDLRELKAAFFVKTFSGNADYERPTERNHLQSRKQGPFVRVTFLDGEVLVGEVSRDADLTKGFYLEVLDPNDNNILVYVNPGALRRPPEE